MMRASRRADSPEVQSPTRIETIRASSEQEDILGALVDYVVSEEHLAEKEAPNAQ